MFRPCWNVQVEHRPARTVKVYLGCITLTTFAASNPARGAAVLQQRHLHPATAFLLPAGEPDVQREQVAIAANLPMKVEPSASPLEDNLPQPERAAV